MNFANEVPYPPSHPDGTVGTRGDSGIPTRNTSRDEAPEGSIDPYACLPARQGQDSARALRRCSGYFEGYWAKSKYEASAYVVNESCEWRALSAIAENPATVLWRGWMRNKRFGEMSPNGQAVNMLADNLAEVPTLRRDEGGYIKVARACPWGSIQLSN